MYFFFFFPVGTDTRRSNPPVGTAILLAMAVGVYALHFLRPDLYYGLVASSFRPSDPSIRQAFLSLFLHGGWSHLLGNGLYLWIFGTQFEGRLGFVRLAVVYFLGGIAACWVQAWLTPPTSWNWDMPVIGASGAVASLLGASVIRFSHQRVRVLYFLFAFLGGLTRGGVVHVNTVLACSFWFVIQIVHGLVAWGNGGAGVAYAAHAGGFVTGVTLAWMLGLHRDARLDVHRERGRRYFERGDWYAAAGELTAHLKLSPDDLEARAMRARSRILLGRTGEAASEYLDLFRRARREEDMDRTAQLYREMRLYGVTSNLSESGLFRLAFRLRKGGHPGEAAEAFLEIETRFPADPKAELAMIRRAEILWSDLGRTAEAQETYRRFLTDYPKSEWRALAEARLGSMAAQTGASGASWPSPRGPNASPGSSPRPSPSGARRS